MVCRYTPIVAILCLAISGCSPGVLGLPLGENSWSLVADEDQALVDSDNPQFGAYPNPRSLKWLKVTVSMTGEVCANDGSGRWCGGPMQGIPYLVVAAEKDSGYCVHVKDIYGNDVRSACTEEPLPDHLVAPEPEEQTNDREVMTAEESVVYGSTLVIDAVNASLAKIGMKTRVSMLAATAARLVDYTRGEIRVSDASCTDVLRYLDSEFSDDHEGTDDYIYDSRAIDECLKLGRCRVGQIVTRAMAAACTTLGEGETVREGERVTFNATATEGLEDTEAAQTGVVEGGAKSVGDLCAEDNPEIQKCVGSPLVLDLANDGLQLQSIAGGVSFALFNAEPLKTGWLAGSDDALLALDIDGDGAITSGRELFGEATGGFAPNGFEALARYDSNNDGVISVEDPVFERLVAWIDNGDGRSSRDELQSLTSLGIRSIALSYKRIEQLDAFGNELGLLGAATTTQGGQIPVIDVWFHMAR